MANHSVNDEEFNNFMMRVNEITKIIDNLKSVDNEKSILGTRQADEYLKNDPKYDTTTFEDGENVITKTKFNKSVINKNALRQPEETNPNQMSLDAFKANVEMDAAQRTKDRKIRTEKSETFKKRGDKALHDGDLSKALTCYNHAINFIKDNPTLYTSRALTYMYLNLYDKAEMDCKTALKLNENSFKPSLYLIKCYIHNDKPYENMIKDIKLKHPKRTTQIDEYVTGVQEQFKSCNGPN